MAGDRIALLKKRAELIWGIRLFFRERNCWETECPLLYPFPAVEEHIESVPAFPFGPQNPPGFLITSPEYPMKRLIAEGAGDCFQLSKAFRRDEAGRFHNTEFTMLEWYRVGRRAGELMDEVGELFKATLDVSGADRKTYREAFEERFGLPPEDFRPEMLPELANADEPWMRDGRATAREGLDYLFSFIVQPGLGRERPVFVTDFPLSQSSLAKANPDGFTCDRFEGFYRGVELCNGCEEIDDPETLRGRFNQINARRTAAGKTAHPLDGQLLAAMGRGFPACSGVALGVDRLVMLALGLEDIRPALALSPEDLRLSGIPCSDPLP